MKILFLLPPSEGKNNINRYDKEELSFNFDKPFDIAINACEKDLKCMGNRFLEGIKLNNNLQKSISLGSQRESPKNEGEGFGTFIEAIHRYTGEMYKAINYDGMDISARKFFEQHFLIFSGMYGIVKPLDKIGNYKLPIETKGLYQFWWEKIPKTIVELKPDYIVNLLPISYAKLIGEFTNCNRHKKKKETILNAGTKIVNINFIKQDGKKVSHGVKKIKGEWINHICENNITDYRDFGGKIIENGNTIEVNILAK